MLRLAWGRFDFYMHDLRKNSVKIADFRGEWAGFGKKSR